jgi:hypothetical protein
MDLIIWMVVTRQSRSVRIVLGRPLPCTWRGCRLAVKGRNIRRSTAPKCSSSCGLRGGRGVKGSC